MPPLVGYLGLPCEQAGKSDANPAAGELFDSLAQFHRNAYVRWIEATKRRPEQRPVRIAEVIALLREGKKEQE